MDTPTFKILRKMIEKREMSYRDFYALLPKKFNDHRDCYIFYSLFNEGYIDVTWLPGIRDANLENLKDPFYKTPIEIMIFFHTMQIKEKEFKYLDRNISQSPNAADKEIVLCTSKTDSFFEERRQKREDRLMALGIGIIIALTSSFLTAYFSKI